MKPRLLEPGLLEDVPRFTEVMRREVDGRLLVCYGAKGWYMIANEDDVTRQSVVLTTAEVRWLAAQWAGGREFSWWRRLLLRIAENIRVAQRA